MTLRHGKRLGVRLSAPTGLLLHPSSRKGQPSLAALPFQEYQCEGQTTCLGEGLAEEVLQGLSEIEGLRVVSRTTSFPFSQSDLTMAEIGRKLEADVLLGGRLTRREGWLALEAELVSTASGLRVWHETFEFRPEDLFPTLERVATGVAAALHLPPPVLERTEVNLEAYAAYLEARHHYYRYSRQGMAVSARMYRRALDIDPGYAPAWAGLATCAAYSFIYLDRSEDQRELAESCSRKALELDPDLAEAHTSRGVALSAAGEAEAAEAAFETALRLDPYLFEAAYFYARHCFAADKPERAVEYFEWAAALRPEDFQSILLVAQVYHSLGVEDEAERARRKGLALVEARLAAEPGDVRARYLGANALVALGEREKGLTWARMARDLDPEDPMLLYNLGCIHALASDPEEALDCLEQAAAGGLSQKNWFEHDGDLDTLRDHPRFQSLLASLGN